MYRVPPVLRLGCLTVVVALASPAATITADFSSTNGNFTASDARWAYTGSAWNLTTVDNLNDTLTSPTFTASGGPVTLQFTHTYNFEATFDGGILELSVNNGAFTYVPNASFSQNGYTGTATPNFLAGLQVFNGTSNGALVSIVSLGTLAAGTDFAFRFHAGTDATVLRAQPNWSIASVTLTNTDAEPGFVSDIPEPSTAALLALGGIALALLGRRKALR